METEDVSRYVLAYRQLRDKKAQVEKLAAEKLKPVIEMMDKIEARLLQMADDQGVNSFATPHGTAYKNKATYVKVEDWDLFQGALVEKLIRAVHAEVVPHLGPNLKEVLTRLTASFRQSDMWDYLTRAANKTVIVELANAEVPVLVPGIKIDSEMKMGFRAPTNKRN